jgi:hypothetical protein
MWSRLRPLLQSPWAIVTVAVALRLAVMVWTRSYLKNPAMEFYDFGAETGRVARAIALGQGFSSPLHGETGPTAWLMPVYPYLLAGIFKVFGIYSLASAVVTVVLNCIFSGLTCLPIYHFGRRTLGEGVALGAAWAWAFHYWSIHVATQWIWDTSLYVLVVALVLQCTLEIPRQERLSRWVGFALLCGFAVMVNTSLALTLPFLGLWICLRRAQRPGWLAPVSLAAAVFLITMVPWFVRNYLTFDRVVFPRSNLGLELYLGNIPNPDNDIFASLLHPSISTTELEQYRQLGELGYMAEKKRQAIEAIQADPREFARRCALRVVNWWFGPWEYILPRWQQGHFAIGKRTWVTVAISLLGLAGLALAWRDRREGIAVYGVMLFFFPLVYYVTQANPRYRLAVDPLLILLAVYAVARWMPGGKRGEPSAWVSPAR